MKRNSFAGPVLFVLAIATGLTPGSRASAKELYSDPGFFIDLPEGCELEGGDGKTSFSIRFPFGDVMLQIKSYDGSRYPSAAAAADDVKKRLGAQMAAKAFVYQRRDAAFGEFAFAQEGRALKGCALFVNGGKEAKEADYVLLAYAPAQDFGASRDAMLSMLDGFSVDAEARSYPGPVSQSAYPWNPSARKTVTVKYGKDTLKVPYDPGEAAAAQELVEREYRVLTAYGAEPELINDAVRRFYRRIFRECERRLDYLALAVSRRHELSGESGKPFDPAAYAAELLSWVQGFTYQQNATVSDVVNPLSAAFENRGDCDSRALLMAILLKAQDLEAILMVSLEYNHALAAVDVPGSGARFPFEGTNWLVAETTDKVAIGQIAKDQSSVEAWIGVRFPY